ncbi:MAG: hypothetical protein QOG55_1582 [Acidobacteriaceae bacterium]|jgi:hypothetical protein|nr:hypothetical protein [Acidobacteriaceae bacterium]
MLKLLFGKHFVDHYILPVFDRAKTALHDRHHFHGRCYGGCALFPAAASVIYRRYALPSRWT